MESLDFIGAPREMFAEPSLARQIFWPLILGVTYFCVAMLMGTAFI